MSDITITDLEPALIERLRARAARHSRSVEEEAREILRKELWADALELLDIAESIRRRFAAVGGVDDLALPVRERLLDPRERTTG